ncbi:MAG: MATE family efflux transporter [Oscillospiraceae bacterium]|nr:MATE family efflux transporter [Oscillospiraceae bacterium]
MAENKLGAMPVGRLLVNMALPLMFSMLVQALYNIVDGIYVARLSEAALTATTLAFPIQMLMNAVAIGTGVGVNSLVARRLGEKRQDAADSAASHGMLLAALSACVFILFGLFAARPFLRLFSGDADLVGMSFDYLFVCTCVSPFLFFSAMGERLLQAAGHATLSMVSQLAGALTNIFLDPVMIFGLCGCPAMGVRGAAVATVVGQGVSCVVALALNHRLNHYVRVRLRGFRFDGAAVSGIYRVGLPAILMQAIGSFMSLCMNAILILFSTTAVAVFGVYFKLQSFVFMPVFGITQGLTPIVGYNYGARRPARIRQAVKLSMISAVGIMLLGTLVFNLFPDRLLALFDAGPEMLDIGARALRIISLGFPLAACSIVMSSSFQGMGIGRLSLINSLLRNVGFILPGAYLFGHFFGLDSIWFAFDFSEIASVVLMSVLFARVWREKIAPMKDGGSSADASGVVK